MKRVLYIFAVLLVSLLLVGGILVAALMSDKVETAAVRLATAEFSRVLGTRARVGAVEYRFPARLRLRDVYVEDQRRDTLVYLGEVYAHFRPLALQNNEILFSHVQVRNGVANIYRLPDSTYNYQFLLDAFASGPKEHQPLRSLIAVEDIQLDSLRVRYDDYHGVLTRAHMDLHRLTERELDAEIRELRGVLTNDRTGEALTVKELAAHVQLNDTLLLVPTLRAKLPNSSLDLSGIEVRYPSGDTLYLSRSAHDIIFHVQVHDATLLPSDIAMLVPAAARMNREVSLQGEIGGTLDSLYFNDLQLIYNRQQVLLGNLTAVGLPDLSNPYLRANMQDVHVTAAQLQDMLSQLSGKPVHLPVQVHRLGHIHYRGLAEGQLHDLKLHGAFRTAVGTVTTDGHFRSDSSFNRMDYDARVVARRLQLGRLLAYAPLGTTTIDIHSNGQVADGRIRGSVQGHVRELTYNGYTYSDFDIDGIYSPQRYEGRVSVEDPHLNIAFNGVVDLHEQNPEINFDLHCRHLDSSPLGIKAIGDHLQTRFRLSADLDGVNPDRMNGYLVLDSLFVATARDSIQMRQLTLLASADAGNHKDFTLRSDYLHATLDGTFRYADIVPSLQAFVHHYLPAAMNPPKQKWSPVDWTLRADGQRLRDLQRLFVAPLTLSDHPTLTARMTMKQGAEPKADMRFYAPGVRAGNTPVHDLTITLNTVDTLRHTLQKGSGVAFGISAEAMQMHTVFSTLAFRDTLLTHLTIRQQSELDDELPAGWRELTPRQLQRALGDLSNKDRIKALVTAQRAGDYGGDIHVVTRFDRYNRRPFIDMHIMPSTMLLRDSVYTIGESRITYCEADTTMHIDHFHFEGGGQHLLANGAISPSRHDTLDVDLQKIDASYVVPFLLPVQTIMFNGLLTGKAQLVSVFRHPEIEAKVHVDSMGLNNCWFGDADVDLHIHDRLQFHADVYRPDRKVVDLNGEAEFGGLGRWNLDMQADSVPLAFINHWTDEILTDLQGNATGHVSVGGWKNMVYVTLNAAAQNASFTLPWTGCRYTIAHDTIVMDTTAILFPHVHLTDAEGHPVEVTGGVYHRQFQNFRLDLHVDVHNALAFDLPDKAGEMLQGKVYASGHVDVTGTEDDILVAADAVTSGKSRFRLSIDNTSSAYESNFVHFVPPKDTARANEDRYAGETDLDNIDIVVLSAKDSAALYSRGGRCLLTLNLEVNPRLLFQLVLGERNGDMIQARGSGALRLTYDTHTGDVRLLGTYDIQQGTLNYTVGNVIRREFTVGEGSTIVFSGDPSNPQLDVTAKYRVTANLKDLFGDEIDQIGTTRTNIPVLTCMHMTGPLSSPILSFSLELPLSDQNIQQQVRQVINTDEMLMRQVIYLLVFSRFFTPDYMNQAQYATLNSTYSLLSSTVTGQINAWLGKLTDIFTLGVAIRADGSGADASQEYEAQFQLQPVDRLVINGNVGYRYNDVSNQPFFGDLDVELLLTEDGQLRLKGYTHSVDKYSLRQASTMQGVSLLWKHDFNWPTVEQMRANREARKKRNEEKKAAKQAEK